MFSLSIGGRFWLAGVIISVLVNLAIYAGIAYVAWHFISKYW